MIYSKEEQTISKCMGEAAFIFSLHSYIWV